MTKNRIKIYKYLSRIIKGKKLCLLCENCKIILKPGKEIAESYALMAQFLASNSRLRKRELLLLSLQME